MTAAENLAAALVQRVEALRSERARLRALIDAPREAAALLPLLAAERARAAALEEEIQRHTAEAQRSIAASAARLTAAFHRAEGRLARERYERAWEIACALGLVGADTPASELGEVLDRARAALVGRRAEIEGKLRAVAKALPGLDDPAGERSSALARRIDVEWENVNAYCGMGITGRISGELRPSLDQLEPRHLRHLVRGALQRLADDAAVEQAVRLGARDPLSEVEGSS